MTTQLGPGHRTTEARDGAIEPERGRRGTGTESGRGREEPAAGQRQRICSQATLRPDRPDRGCDLSSDQDQIQPRISGKEGSTGMNIGGQESHEVAACGS
jgi:hypothetical protein